MINVSSELRYDPDDDDSQPARSPSGLVRALTAAAGAAADAQSPADVYEQVCRALAEQGIAAAVLVLRGGPGRFVPLAHRLSIAAPAASLSLPGLEQALAAAVAYPAAAHPLSSVLPPEGALLFPSLAAPLPAAGGAARTVVSLWAPELGPEHLAAAEAFAALLAATVARVEAEARVRELSARVEQRVRARTSALDALTNLSLALTAASNERDAARLTVAGAVHLLASDVVAALVCADERHDIIAASPRASLTPAFLSALADRLHERFAALVGDAHRGCRAGLTETVEPSPPRLPSPNDPGHPPPPHGDIALDGEPGELLHAPLATDGGAIGLFALANAQPSARSSEQVRLFYTVAGQLATAARHAAAARAAERQRLNTLLEGFADGVVLLDGDRRLLAGNRPGRALLAALTGPGTDAALPAPVAALVTAALQGDTGAAGPLVTGDDPPRSVAAAATRLTGTDSTPIIALTLHDTTDAELMRERLFQSEKMASVGRLVSGVAHELNNPLTGIMGFAQLLLMCTLDDDARHRAETIFREAERASKIVHNLLSFARRRRPEKTAVDLNALIERVLELWEYEVRIKDIEVQRRFARRLPPCLADPHQVQQVLLNVLGNAAQAIAAAHGHGTITIRTAAAGGYVRVVIADDGPGIPPEHLRRVFDPFFTTRETGEGTGLGLTICYGIIEEHNGRITVDSPPGGGATVTVELPQADAAAGTTSPPAGVSAGASVTRSVLVVDDEHTIRELLSSILSLDGHEVVSAASGAEALERISARAFDAVITDVYMPGMDGMEFYRRAQERNPALARRVIFTSGDTVSREMRTFVEAEALPFLDKPFTVQEVQEVVASVMADLPPQPPL